jgi:hypothetical protein
MLAQERLQDAAIALGRPLEKSVRLARIATHLENPIAPA